jgi:DNA-binding CsgD family transcriptional regulator/pimeloyl-ACP methyl ester carboxylesterase
VVIHRRRAGLVDCRVINGFGGESRQGPQWPFVDAIARGRRLVVYDGLGSGLSDRSFLQLSVEQSVRDLAAVADAAGLERFAVFADAAGPQAAIAYAAAYPQRVERVAVHAGMARGLLRRDPSPREVARREALYAAAETGWDDAAPTFRMLNAHDALPEATPAEQSAFARFTGGIVSGRGFVAFMRAQAEADVTEQARQVRCPVLVAQPTRSLRVPFDEGRRLASLIPATRLLPIDSANMSLMASEPVFAAAVVAAVRDFLDEARADATDGLAAGLTPRERQVLELMARGLDNLQIAAHLGLSAKTVRNHVPPIFDKLGVESRAQAIVRARQAGLGGAVRGG